MLGPVSEGGAVELFLDYRPVSQVSFIAISFRLDSTSEKRLERERGRRFSDTLNRVISFGLCLVFFF